MVEVMVSGLPHVLRIRLEISRSVLSVRHFCFNKSFFASVELHGDHKTVTNLRLMWPPCLDIISF